MSQGGSFEDFRRGLVAKTRRGGPENLVIVERVPSTNLLARRIRDDYLREGLTPPPAALVAYEQSAGRGSRGRGWASPPGCGVYATLLLSVAAPEELQVLPLLVAVGLAGGVNRWLGAELCRVKWPNDLLVGGRKLGGILIEAQTVDEGGAVLIAGFGVNCRDAAGGLPSVATSLEREGVAVPDLASVAADLLSAVGGALAHLADAGFAVDRYRQLSVHHPGDQLRCRVGSEEIEGTFRGFDGRGFLRLESGGEERLITAGEVVEHGI